MLRSTASHMSITIRPATLDDEQAVLDLIEQLRGLAALGFQTAIGSVKDVHTITPLEVMGRDVIPAVADL